MNPNLWHLATIAHRLWKQLVIGDIEYTADSCILYLGYTDLPMTQVSE